MVSHSKLITLESESGVEGVVSGVRSRRPQGILSGGTSL